MEIKQRIGERIRAARKQSGLTIKALSDRTGELKPARISNWEQGLRTPRPREVNMIAEILGVSPAYLLCLTDIKEVSQRSNDFTSVVPILSDNHISNATTELPSCEDVPAHLPISNQIANQVSSSAFAYDVSNTSMAPLIEVGDILIADPNKAPEPSHFIIAYHKNKVLVRKLRDNGTNGLELVPINDDWPTHQINSLNELSFVATVVELRRTLI